MKSGVITIYKELGETPLAALDRLRVDQPQYVDATLSYIGRLDPMAEGDMLVLVGEENKNREAYLGLDKEYECEVLFGFSTDTHDLLGFVEQMSASNISKSAIEATLQSFIGKHMQTYPAYSSKPVAGKALHEWAREGKLDEIEMPQKEVEIYAIELLDFRTIALRELHATIRERIGLVLGDFRQQEILKKWDEIFLTAPISFPVAKIRVACLSGTYMRSLAANIGAKLNVPALAMSIKRTHIVTTPLSGI